MRESYDPATIASMIEQAERLAAGGRLMRLPPLQRRRLLARAVFEELRREDEPTSNPLVIAPA